MVIKKRGRGGSFMNDTDTRQGTTYNHFQFVIFRLHTEVGHTPVSHSHTHILNESQI